MRLLKTIGKFFAVGFSLVLSIVLINNFIFAPIKDFLQVKALEKRAVDDKINHDIDWPEHIGIYGRSGADVVSDIDASILYGGHSKKITKHSYNKEGQVIESRSYWLEYRDECPDISKKNDFNLNTNFRHAAVFHSDMGLCLLSEPTEHIVEPIQIISKYKWRPDETSTRELLILNSTTSPDLNPNQDVILAKLTHINYRKAARIRFSSYSWLIYPPLGLYLESDSAIFVSSRLPVTPQHVSIRPNKNRGNYSSLRYISNIGNSEQGKHLVYKSRSTIKNPHELIPTRAEKIIIASEAFAKLTPNDFPLNERNSRLVSLFRSRVFREIRNEIDSNWYETVINNTMAATTAELKFLRSSFDVDTLKIRKGYIHNARSMVVNFDRLTNSGARYDINLMELENSEDFKNTLFDFVLELDREKIGLQGSADERLTLQTSKAIYNLTSKILLEDGDVRHDVSNAILNKNSR